MKIAVAAISGSHLMEMLALEDSWSHEEVLFLADRHPQSSRLEQKYRVVYTDRVENNPLLFIKSLFTSFSLALSSKPGLAIGMPSSSTFFFLLFSKLLGAKLIVIEPFGNSEKSGFYSKALYKFADLFLVQWQDLLDTFPNGEYSGSVF